MPEPKIVSDTTPETEVYGYTRRAFHLAAIYVLGGLIGLALAIPTILYLLVPPRLRRNSKFLDAGDIGQFATGSPVNVSFQENRIDGWKVTTEKRTAWVVKEPSGQLVAFGAQCTHLACAYHWEEGKHEFVCPCHNSIFALDGKVISGPAPRPLDRYETRIQDNRLQIGELRQSAEG